MTESLSTTITILEVAVLAVEYWTFRHGFVAKLVRRFA